MGIGMRELLMILKVIWNRSVAVLKKEISFLDQRKTVL